MLVTLKCEITFEERETGKILYHTDNFLFRNEYEIPTVVNPSTGQVNPATLAGFFEEQDPALDRLAQGFATRLVAAGSEDFRLTLHRRGRESGLHLLAESYIEANTASR